MYWIHNVVYLIKANKYVNVVISFVKMWPKTQCSVFTLH